MTFLSKLGGLIVKGLAIVTGIAPIIQQIAPQAAGALTVVSSDLVQIASIVQNVEVFGQSLGLSGADKLRGAGPLVAQIVLTSALMANKKVANGPLFTQACTEIAGGVADLLNSLHADAVTETSAT